MDHNDTIRPEVEEEAQIIILTSGEMPEVAFYDSRHQLENEGIALNQAELRVLEEAVLQRYRNNIERDLDPDNMTEARFRGPRRAWYNWNRMKGYAGARGFDLSGIRRETGEMLTRYIALEAEAVSSGRTYNTLGMTALEVSDFCRELGLNGARLNGRIDLVLGVPGLDFKKAIAAARLASKKDN